MGISRGRGRSTISPEEASMSRWPGVKVALSVGMLVFAGSAQGYNGGPLRNVTDLTPQCAGCHSSMSKEDLRVEPEAFATSQLVEAKHYKAIEEGSGSYKDMSPGDRHGGCRISLRHREGVIGRARDDPGGRHPPQGRAGWPIGSHHVLEGRDRHGPLGKSEGGLDGPLRGVPQEQDCAGEAGARTLMTTVAGAFSDKPLDHWEGPRHPPPMPPT